MLNSLRFITGLRWYKGLLETLSNMTFIYDVNWNPNNSPKSTFPVCFFHVKSYHEVMNSEVSQKQMLFYNSSLEASKSDPAVATDVSEDSGLLNVVADNIVIKPKVYKLDVVIPFRQLTLLDQSFVYNTQTLQAMHEVLINTKSSTKRADELLGSYSTISQPFITLIKTIMTTLINYKINEDSIDQWIEVTSHQPDYNKESLEVMWRMRHILKMKMWNSWRYKYVAINDIDITKEGTEDGVYEATITVQEMPIVSMYPEGMNTKKKFEQKNLFLMRKGYNLIKILNKAGGELGKGELQ